MAHDTMSELKDMYVFYASAHQLLANDYFRVCYLIMLSFIEHVTLINCIFQNNNVVLH